MIRTRFAPSPNGPLHLGHAYAAIIAHDLAQASDGARDGTSDGAFLLRVEDIDGERSRESFVDQMLADLAWLGIAWDPPMVRQSARLDSYAQAGERLKAMGLLYPCTCTRAEVASAAHELGPDGPVYPGTCRHRDIDLRTLDPATVAWRLDVAAALAQTGPLTWTDTIAGPQCAEPEPFGDVVLLRRGLPASYHLAATLDDAADGITLVTRGRDLFAATHVHRLLQALLGLPVPAWHHHALLVEAAADKPERKLAKRRGSPALADLRTAGQSGSALADSLRSHRLPAGIKLSHELPCLT